MKLKLIIIVLTLFVINSYGEVVIKKPIKKRPTTFAIIVDKTTYEKVGSAVDAYRDAVEEDGLSTYILINDWKNPDEIKNEILKLYKNKPPLEGIVLVGDIPIPMIRNAQHMTSAFKLDENMPMYRSSVPSDRFYDDFDLKFNFIKQDSLHKLCFYYSLAPDSPQRVNKDIYSGRIKPSVEDETRYEVIKKYLLRVAEQKKEQVALDNIMVFTGHGYNSESITSWADENLALREQFPSLYKTGGKLKKLNFSMSPKMKEIVLTELQQPQLDMAIFHAHGDDDRQYIVDYPTANNPNGNIESVKLYLRSKLRTAKRRKQSIEEAKKYFMKEYNVPEHWFDGAFSDSVQTADSLLDYSLDIHIADVRSIAPQPRLVIFDECFNGSFHVSPYISGEYVFGNGKTIAGIANTTNALQDQWIDSYMGLLGYGVRAGQWHRMDNLLESHLIGDPTFHYRSSNHGTNLNNQIVLNEHDVKLWKDMAKSEDPNLRSLGIYMLFRNLGRRYENELAGIYMKDESFNVRMHALEYLSQLNTPVFEDILKVSVSDPYELIRRISAEWMGKIGKKEYLPLMAKQMINDESERVSFNHKSTIVFIDPQAAYDECVRYVDSMPETVSKNLLKDNFKISIQNSSKWLNEELLPNVKNDTIKVKQRLKDLRTFRNYNFLQALPDLMEIAKKVSEPKEIRVAVLEALGWYALAHDRAVIIKACDEIMSQKEVPAEVKDEALRTKNRLTEGYSNTITS
ncbi:MAG: HEAT repeat domain-containing protein [Ignavibacteriales bacterium]